MTAREATYDHAEIMIKVNSLRRANPKMAVWVMARALGMATSTLYGILAEGPFPVWAPRNGIQHVVGYTNQYIPIRKGTQ